MATVPLASGKRKPTQLSPIADAASAASTSPRYLQCRSLKEIRIRDVVVIYRSLLISSKYSRNETLLSIMEAGRKEVTRKIRCRCEDIIKTDLKKII